MVRRAASGKLGEYAKVWHAIDKLNKLIGLLHFILRYLCRLQAYHCILYILGSRNRVSQIGFDSNVCKFGSGWTGKLYDTEYIIYCENDLRLRFSTNQFKIYFRTLCVF